VWGGLPDNEIAIQDPEVSRRHALFTFSGGLYQVEDTGSTNGSFVNGRRVQGTVILQHGDRIQLGESITLIFQEDVPAPGYADEWADDEWSGRWRMDRGRHGGEPADVSALAPTPAPPNGMRPKWPIRTQSHPLGGQAASFEEPGPSRTRQLLLGCGCGFLLFGVLCVGPLFFLDAYDQGRLLYCGPALSLFDSLLGPIGFNPACHPTCLSMSPSRLSPFASARFSTRLSPGPIPVAAARSAATDAAAACFPARRWLPCCPLWTAIMIWPPFTGIFASR
jgi:hypothetical protein